MIKKNRRENGRREEDFGSNPHSKGEHFSRSTKVFFDKIEAKIITINEIIIIIEEIIIIEKIIYTIINRPYDWKSNILLYYIDNYEMINLLINKLWCIKIIILHLQNVNIKLQLQIQNDDFLKNDCLNVVINKLIKRLSQLKREHHEIL